MSTEVERKSLERQIEEARENLSVIKEVMSKHIDPAAIPPQITKTYYYWQHEIERLKSQQPQSQEAQQAQSKPGAKLDLSECLSLIRLNPTKSAHVLLQMIPASWKWTPTNLDDVRRQCSAAMEYAHETNDQAGIGLAFLHWAAAEAQSNNLKGAIELTQKGIPPLEFLGDDHNLMIAHLLLAHLELESQSFSRARAECNEGLNICERLKERQISYNQIAERIQETIEYIARANARKISDTYQFLCSIPVRRLSDGPDTVISGHANTAYYTSTGKFVIGEHTYHPHLLLARITWDVYFILVVPKGSWSNLDLSPLEGGQLDYDEQQDNYILMRKEIQVLQEGPGAVWTGDNWISCNFVRNTVGAMQFEPHPPKVIGMASVAAFLEP